MGGGGKINFQLHSFLINSIHGGQTHVPNVLTRRNNNQNRFSGRPVRPHSLFRNKDNYTRCSLSEGLSDVIFSHRQTDIQTAKELWDFIENLKVIHVWRTRPLWQCVLERIVWGKNKVSCNDEVQKLFWVTFMWSHLTKPMYFICKTGMMTIFVFNFFFFCTGHPVVLSIWNILLVYTVKHNFSSI
jgi:hypothetical protein